MCKYVYMHYIYIYYMQIYSKSAYILNVTRTIIYRSNNEKTKKSLCTVHHTYSTSFTLHLHTTGCPSRIKFAQWSIMIRGDQNRNSVWLVVFTKPLIKPSNLQHSRMIWVSHNSTRNGDRMSSSCTLLIKLVIIGAK